LGKIFPVQVPTKPPSIVPLQLPTLGLGLSSSLEHEVEKNVVEIISRSRSVFFIFLDFSEF
jgi:hypothetical protein